LLLGLCLLAQGCVERTIEIRSDPPGAHAFLDRTWKGRTPLTVPFGHYGVREIAVELEGFRPLARVETISAPWYQIFPLDFFFECLFPFTLHDRRVFEFRLEKTGSPVGALKEKDREELLERAGTLRKSLE